MKRALILLLILFACVSKPTKRAYKVSYKGVKCCMVILKTGSGKSITEQNEKIWKTKKEGEIVYR